MKPNALLRAALITLACIAPPLVQAQDAINASGTLRSRSQTRQSPTAELELRASTPHWSLIGTTDSTSGRGVMNEAAFNTDLAGWQITAGKKIVGWDVGYAFRPNDVVQQEERRTLVSNLPEGRPLLMADYISADSAWTLVAVNPTADASSTGAQEPALAARYYLHSGNVDWHAFARAADRTGSSAGAAVAWVASDSTELHASVRVTAQAQRLALVGGTWTSASQVSVLLEGWWDGTAQPPDPRARAHQRNVYMRLSWEHEGWQPSLDVLLQPDDGGRMATAALQWKGDRIKVQGGLRVHGGPADSVLAQAPVQRQSYVVVSWAF